jgi:hypothetical protein
VHLQPEQIEVPRRRFAHVHVDWLVPFPAQQDTPTSSRSWTEQLAGLKPSRLPL